jgi:FMN phosphatase YigB (HAD superfamily)
MAVLQNTSHLVFDLGGVIIDLSMERTILEFSRLAGISPAVLQREYLHDPVFLNYEKGLIDSDLFRASVCELLGTDVADEEFDHCWNAMLVDLPAAKLQLLTTLKNHFHISVLSNINAIHYDYINRVMLNGGNLDDYFHQHHYSHLVNMRKPDREIYEQVLQVSGHAPEHTLFLDDNAANIAAASSLGIQTFHVTHPQEVLKFFHSYV